MRRPVVPNSSVPVPTLETNRMQELSFAYVSIIAAHAGIKIEIVGRNDDGTDVRFLRLRKRAIDDHISDMDSIPVPCQIKSALRSQWNPNEEDDTISYKLRAKNYNDIVGSTLGFLVLMCLPESLDAAVAQDPECLHLYKCCYYWFPGPDDTKETDNSSTKTIHISRQQLFTAKELANIVDGEEVSR